MTTPGIEADVRAIEELLNTLAKGQRALQMYLPNNPMYQRAVEQIGDGFVPVWGFTGRLVLDLVDGEFQWEGMPVQRGGSRGEGLAAHLYADGLRRLVLLPGAEVEEMVRFLAVVNRARLLPQDASDDLLTLLWEQEFVLIAYTFVEALTDGTEFLQSGGGVSEAKADPEAVKADANAPPPPGSPSPADLDSAPFFLDEAEVRMLQAELEDEYRRDIRTSAIDALLDTLEAQKEPAVRKEIVALLEDVLPVQLADGGFRAVARILHELRLIAVRAPGLDRSMHEALLSFEARLSEPEILEQLFRTLDDPIVRPNEGDIGEVLRELKASALPVVLGHLGRTLSADVRRALMPSVEQLVRTRPEALQEIIERGEGDGVEPAIELAGRLGLTTLIPGVAGRLKDPSVAIRVAVVNALGVFGTPTAITGLESALEDSERVVWEGALTLLVARGGSPRTLSQLERLLFEQKDDRFERSERRALFEAYGTLAGDRAVPRLTELLAPRGLFRRTESPDVRACAIFALAKIRSFDARMVVDRYSADKEAVVRSAANSVLRDWLA